MSKLSSLPKAERTAVIAETDRLFRERTGVTRRLDPAHDGPLVKRWLKICDEVMTGRATAAGGGGSSAGGSVGGGIGSMLGSAIGSAVGAVAGIPTAAGAGLAAAAELASDAVSDVPRWVRIARSQIGVREAAGSAVRPEILQYILTCTENFEASGYGWANRNDWQAWVRRQQAAGNAIPMRKPTNLLKFFLDGEGRGANDEGFYWCAAFVNWCLGRAGINGANHASVSQWRNWGERLTEPRVGAILIKPRGSSNWGHIAFVDRVDGRWKMLGGNQAASAGGESNQVSRRAYPGTVTALLWPHGVPKV